MSASQGVAAAVDGGGIAAAAAPTPQQQQQSSSSAGAGAGAGAGGAATHHTGDGRFRNPWDGWVETSFMRGMKYARERQHPDPPSSEEMKEKFPLERTSVAELARIASLKDDSHIVWIGHASFLICIGGKVILTDPIFSDRCSPIPKLAGPMRICPPPFRIQDLPKVDFVCISHNHYDHLDTPTITELEERFHPKFMIPMGLRSYFCASSWLSSVCRGAFPVPHDRVVEYDWWNSVKIPDTSLTFSFVPAQHWSTRDMFDRNRSLWGGWVVKSDRHSVYFSGDTGFCPAFKQIGEALGPFDVALLPLGAYCPRDFMRPQHVDPAESVVMHNDLLSKISIGMHWGTFILSDEPVMDPPRRLRYELQKAGINENSFGCVRIGKLLSVNELLAGGMAPHWRDFAWARAEDAVLGK